MEIRKTRIRSEVASEQTGVRITPIREQIKKVRIRPNAVTQPAVVTQPSRSR